MPAAAIPGGFSTDEQNPAPPTRSIDETPCPAPLSLKKLEHAGTLIVWKLDRLDRSLRDLITTLDDLRARGVKFFHSFTPTGRAMWQMIAFWPNYMPNTRMLFGDAKSFVASRVKEIAAGVHA